MNGKTNVTVSGGNDSLGGIIPLNPPTAFVVTADNAKCLLTWTDPLDKYATPVGEQAQESQQLVSLWDHTVLVRKTGSQPTGPHDGISVVSSSVRNQYQSTTYIDAELINDTTYHYGIFAYNTDGVASEGVFTSATPKAGTPLGNLAVGTVVKAPVNGKATSFIVVHQGKPASMYDDSCNGTWLLLKDIYAMSSWDSSDNNYKNSDIHSYLNGTFLNVFDDGIKNVINQVKIPYQNGTGAGGSVASGANGLSCKIFLLSAYELGWTTSDNSYFPRDGAKLSYFDSGDNATANNKRIAKYNGSATKWWLRSPDPGDSSVWAVYANGSYDTWNCNDDYGVRPALILPFDIFVDDELNILISGSNIAA